MPPNPAEPVTSTDGMKLPLAVQMGTTDCTGKSGLQGRWWKVNIGEQVPLWPSLGHPSLLTFTQRSSGCASPFLEPKLLPRSSAQSDPPPAPWREDRLDIHLEGWTERQEGIQGPLNVAPTQGGIDGYPVGRGAVPWSLLPHPSSLHTETGLPHCPCLGLLSLKKEQTSGEQS